MKVCGVNIEIKAECKAHFVERPRNDSFGGGSERNGGHVGLGLWGLKWMVACGSIR